jgi:hypothetical protein
LRRPTLELEIRTSVFDLARSRLTSPAVPTMTRSVAHFGERQKIATS